MRFQPAKFRLTGWSPLAAPGFRSAAESVEIPLTTIKEYCGTMAGEARDEADRSYGWSAPTAR
jgi:hypothetical protein